MAFQIADITPPPKGDRPETDKITDLDRKQLDLLARPVYATVATMRASGPPHLTTVWYSHDDTHFYLNSAKGRIKDRNLRARPELSMMIMNPDDPYHWISVEGRVVEMIDEEDPNGQIATDHVDDLAEFYVNKRPYPSRNPAGEVRVRYKIEPTRIICFGPMNG